LARTPLYQTGTPLYETHDGTSEYDAALSQQYSAAHPVDPPPGAAPPAPAAKPLSGARVNIVGPDGDLYDVPAEQLAAAQTRGYHIESDAERISREVSEENPILSAVHTAFSRAASAATFGATDVIQDKLLGMTPFEIAAVRGIEKQHGTAGLIGEGAGFILGMAAGGPALGAAGKGGAAVGASAASRVGLTGGGLAARMVESTARYGTEGLAMAAPKAFLQAVTGDPDLAAETFAWGVGGGAVLGMAGPLAGAAGKGMKGMLPGADRFTFRTIGTKPSLNIAGKEAARLGGPDAIGKYMREDPRLMQEMGETKEAWFERIKPILNEENGSKVGGFYTGVDAHLASGDPRLGGLKPGFDWERAEKRVEREVMKDFEGTPFVREKEAAVRGAMADFREKALGFEGRAAMDAASSDLGALEKSLVVDRAKIEQTLAKERAAIEKAAAKERASLEKSIAKERATTEKAGSKDHAKHNVADYGIRGGAEHSARVELGGVLGAPGPRFATTIGAADEAIASRLAAVDAMAAERIAALESSAAKQIAEIEARGSGQLAAFEAKGQSQMAAAGKKVASATEASKPLPFEKAWNWRSTLDNAIYDARRGQLTDKQQALEKVRSILQEELEGQSGAIHDAMGELGKVAELKEANRRYGLGKAIEAGVENAVKIKSQNLSIGLTDTIVGSAAGSIAGGIPGVALGIAGALANKLVRARGDHVAARIFGGGGMLSLEKSFGLAFERMKTLPSAVAGEVATHRNPMSAVMDAAHSIAAKNGTEAPTDKHQAMAIVTGELTSLASNPQKMQARIQEILARMSPEIPEAVKGAYAMHEARKIMYLAQTAPKSAAVTNPYQRSNTRPNDTAIHEWAQRFLMGVDPYASLSLVANRTLSAAGIDALRNMHPQTYASILARQVNEAVDGRLKPPGSYGGITKMSMFNGSPLDRNMEAVGRLQSIYSAQAAGGTAAQQAGPRKLKGPAMLSESVRIETRR
jgi:hypothetical protein